MEREAKSEVWAKSSVKFSEGRNQMLKVEGESDVKCRGRMESDVKSGWRNQR